MRDEEHRPVLLKESLAFLSPLKGKRVIDATLGFGGHTRGLLEKGAKVLAIDWDPEMISFAKKRFRSFFESACSSASLKIREGNFARIKEIAERNDFVPVDGIIFDLGISRWHLKKAGRGFSFSDNSFDGRLNPELPLTMGEVVNSFSQEKLEDIFSRLVQEPLAAPLAEAIVKRRKKEPISSARELAELIEKVYRKKGRKPKSIHPATKVFLALRIVINQERENLEQGLEGGWQILKKGGRLVVISFHSGEDRIVKLFLKGKREAGEAGIILKKAIYPGAEEIKNNPSARSAILRGGEKK